MDGSSTLIDAPVPQSRRDPTADALDASVRLARLRRRMFAKVEVARIAQYQVVRPIGGGGMGLVFAAWDPSLDRLVAIKVLRDPWSSDAGSNLRREAVSLARLQHPSVVSVFEVGEHEGQVYLAMEYVEGQTLRAWTQAWRQAAQLDYPALLDVFAQAAEGLAAAHAAGVVHRDIKPENVMIDGEGRTRLMDFGLAGREARNAPTHDGETAHDDRDLSTRSDGIFGTPAYMAPEQFSGKAGPQADQFALGACLFEAVYGKRIRPSRMEPASVVAEEAIVLPNQAGVPKAVRAILTRTLQVDPSARFGSMRQLADALGQAQRPRSGRAALTMTALAIGGLLGALALGGPRETRCTGALSQIESAWNDDRARTMGETFVAEGGPAAEATWARLRPRIDDYRDRWVAAHEATCEAAQIRGDISTTQMDHRMTCLRDRRAHLAALADVLGEGGVAALADGQPAVGALPSIDECADPKYLARAGYTEETVVDDEAVAAVARAKLQLLLSDAKGARVSAARAVDAARSEGGHALAQALLVRGLAEATLREDTAYDTLVSAYEHARTVGADQAAAEAAGALVGVCHWDLQRPDEALWWLRIADLELPRGVAPRLDVRRDVRAARALVEVGRRDDARARIDAAVDGLALAYGDDAFLRARQQIRIASMYASTGQSQRALDLATEARDVLARTLGESHPELRHAELALASMARQRGDIDQAIAHGRRGVALEEATFGAHHLVLEKPLRELAMMLADAGQWREALTLLERAAALSQPLPLPAEPLAKIEGQQAEILLEYDPARALGPATRAYEVSRDSVGDDARATVRYLALRARVLAELGRDEEAIADARRALDHAQTVLGQEHYDLAAMHQSLAGLYARTGRVSEAVTHYTRAVELTEGADGTEAFELIFPLVELCGALVADGRPEAALTHCERAAALQSRAKGSSDLQQAKLQTQLSKVMTQLGHVEQAQAHRALAEAAWRRTLGDDADEETIGAKMR